MRSLIFYAESRSIGGDSKYLYELMNRLCDKGYDIKCFCNPAVAGHLRENARREIPIKTVITRHAVCPEFSCGGRHPITRKISNVIRELHLIRFRLLKICFIASNAAIIYGFLRKEKIDIFHINNGGYPAAEGCIAAIFASRFAGARKIVMSVHNLPQRRNRYTSFAERAIDAMAAGCLHKIVVATRAVEKKLIEDRGFPAALIARIPYGVEKPGPKGNDRGVKAEFGFQEDVKMLVVSARFDGTKGQEYLLQALSLLNNSRRKFKCFFLGEGHMRKIMMQMSERLGLKRQAVFTGFRTDVARFLNVADILIQPSVAYENSPYAILEAMAFGIPVVATDVGGVAELVEDGISGLVVAPRDPQALRRALDFLFENEARARLLGANGKKRVFDKFSMENSLRKTMRLYFEGGR